jgi:predicted phosphohydrolase
MRILYMSDLHLEMESFRLAIPGWAEFLARHKRDLRHPSRGPMLNEAGKVDLVVLAGDIHNGLRGIVYAEQVAAYLDAPVVMIAGNHEYYHHDAAVLLPALRAAAQKTERVHFLENASAVFEAAGEKVKVLGSTLWTDFALHGDPAGAALNAHRIMNDYRFIDLDRKNLVPGDTRRFHESSRQWLHEALADTEAGVKRVVVSHHAPAALALGHRQGAIAPAYASEIIGAFADRKLDLWIHGHTHFRHDSLVAGVRLVSAPRGYVGHDGAGALQFKPGIVEV